MESSMTPSKEITAGQIGKIQDLLSAGLRKSGLRSDPTQQVIETQGDDLVTELVNVVRKRVEAVSNLIVRLVKVNRGLSPQEALDATGRAQYTDKKVVKRMPNGKGDEVEVCLFNLGSYVSDADLDKEYALRGLVPADPHTLAALNQVDPAFGDDHPNGTHWKDGDGNWCFAAFRRWDDERGVDVSRRGDDWDDVWWFAGVRK